MRVIHGRYRGYRFPEYRGDNTRPTSDLVKESLFNILEQYLEWDDCVVIDLFAGTGNVGVECLSRGAGKLISVDHSSANVRYMHQVKKQLGAENWDIYRSDAMDFIESITVKPCLLFADPPYAYAPVHELVGRILRSPWFTEQGSLFVLEHPDRLVFNHKNVFLKKQYGNTGFTLFKPEPAVSD